MVKEGIFHMSTTKVVGLDRVTDSKNNTQYIVDLKTAFEVKGETLFKKSSIVVSELPKNIFGATVIVDWKSNTISKVEAK
jgi:hypothetical protein